MFILSIISDLIRIPPHTFNVPIQESLKNEIHKKYSNKVLSNIGLAITLWDILQIKEGLLKPGDGGSYVEIKFRMIIWKPFIGETIEGIVTDCTIEGIKVKLEFFDDILIPKHFLFENCEFKGTEKAWVWKPDEDNEFFIDVGERIRFRVEEEVFFNIKPKIENTNMNSLNMNLNNNNHHNNNMNSSLNSDDSSQNVPPYALIGSCQSDGMGCVTWWD